MTLAEILAKLPDTVSLIDNNNETTLICDIDASDDPGDYILDADQIIRMRSDGYRDYVAYHITDH